MLKTSAFFCVWEVDVRSSMVRSFPSIRAENSELRSVDARLMFVSTSGGIVIVLITWRDASIDCKSSDILGVRVYLGGINICS